jgi:uncharacterized protein YcbX
MRVVDLYRYPVKGFSADRLDAIDLAPGGTLPLDRAYAVENGPSGFDPAAPKHLSKMKFLVLAAEPRVAELVSTFDDDGHRFTLARGGRTLLSETLATAAGRAAVEAFLAGYFAAELRGAPRLLAHAGHSFSDIGDKAVHIVNLASLRDLEARLGAAIDPMRFRANLYVDDLPAWAEFDLLGGEIACGAVKLAPFHRTRRCAATMVNLTTARRDLPIPAALHAAYGHSDLGIYARVTAGGRLAVGDRFVTTRAPAPPPAA